jgi:hypothetical protein
MKRSSIFILALFTLGHFFTLSCDSSSASDAETSDCGAPQGYSCFETGWSVSVDGVNVSLAQATPALPERGENTWVIQLDEQETPIEGCTLSVTPYMLEHMHGVPTPPVVSELGEGTYQVAQINLIMPGQWDLTFSFTCEARELDVTYSFWL